MTQPAVLVIDVGTTVLKTSLFDYRCRPVERVAREHGIEGRNPVKAADRLWVVLKGSIAALVGRNPDRRISVVGLTGFMHYAFPLDVEGKVLPCEASAAEVRASFDDLLNRFGVESIYQTTGSRLDVRSVPAQLLAWRKQDPQVFEKTATLLPVKDLLRHRLTGEMATDETDACGTMFYNLREHRWDGNLPAYCSLDAKALPPVRHCTEQAGVVSSSAARELGLPAGVPVAVGGGDDIEILGSGARSVRHVCEHVGSTGSFLLPVRNSGADPKRRLELYPAVARDEWVLGGSCSNVSRALDWFLNSSAYGSSGSIGWERARAALTKAMNGIPYDRPIFLPYLYGERAPIWDPDQQAQWFGLRHSHTASDLLVSVVEGICFSLRNVLEAFKDLGLEIDLVHSSGGFNELGTQRLRASIYGKPIRLVRGADPTSFAACAIALTAVGELHDPCEAIEWLEFEPDVDPEPAWQPKLDDRFACFLGYTRRVPLPLGGPPPDFFAEPQKAKKC